MKNRPMRERIHSHAPYTKYDKSPYKYAGWVTEKRSPPENIAQELFMARKLRETRREEEYDESYYE